MIEPDIMVDKRGPLVFRVLFDREECDRVLEDRGIEIVGPAQREAVKMDGDDGGNGGSHVQEAFGRRLKMEGLIYPGNNPEQIMPKYQIAAAGARSMLRQREDDCGGKIRAAAQQLRAGSGVGNGQDKRLEETRETVNGFSPS